MNGRYKIRPLFLWANDETKTDDKDYGPKTDTEVEATKENTPPSNVLPPSAAKTVEAVKDDKQWLESKLEALDAKLDQAVQNHAPKAELDELKTRIQSLETQLAQRSKRGFHKAKRVAKKLS